jgi:hypothetical protein
MKTVMVSTPVRYCSDEMTDDGIAGTTGTVADKLNAYVQKSERRPAVEMHEWFWLQYLTERDCLEDLSLKGIVCKDMGMDCIYFA